MVVSNDNDNVMVKFVTSLKNPAKWKVWIIIPGISAGYMGDKAFATRRDAERAVARYYPRAQVRS